MRVAVCVLPGTELSFAGEVECVPRSLVWGERVINHKTAIFRQINQEKKWRHHDALEFPDGETVLLTFLQEGQKATVLQLPAAESNLCLALRTKMPRSRNSSLSLF
jgi:hypothetical protein